MQICVDPQGLERREDGGPPHNLVEKIKGEILFKFKNISTNYQFLAKGESGKFKNHLDMANPNSYYYRALLSTASN